MMSEWWQVYLRFPLGDVYYLVCSTWTSLSTVNWEFSLCKMLCQAQEWMFHRISLQRVDNLVGKVNTCLINYLFSTPSWHYINLFVVGFPESHLWAFLPSFSAQKSLCSLSDSQNCSNISEALGKSISGGKSITYVHIWNRSSQKTVIWNVFYLSTLTNISS